MKLTNVFTLALLFTSQAYAQVGTPNNDGLTCAPDDIVCQDHTRIPNPNGSFCDIDDSVCNELFAALTAEMPPKTPGTYEANCSQFDDTCWYGFQPDTSGFYVATVRFPASNNSSATWSLDVRTITQESDYHIGMVVPAGITAPSLSSFYLTEPGRVNLTPYEYSGQLTTLSVSMKSEELQEVFSATTEQGNTLTTGVLPIGFYTIEVSGATTTADAFIGLSVETDGSIYAPKMIGNANMFGVSEGFFGFFVDESEIGYLGSAISLQLLSDGDFSGSQQGDVQFELGKQTVNGSLDPRAQFIPTRTLAD